MPHYRDHWFNSKDGLRLYARDYRHSTPRATIVCIPGLTRNSADFAQLCEHLAAQYRIIATDLRGRGHSAYDPDPLNYHPGVYAEDVIALLDSLNLESVVLIGTSLGGLTSMILAATAPDRISAMIINDVGPETEAAGLDRIRSYVGNTPKVESWAEAVETTRELQGEIYPNLTDLEWMALAKNIYRENTQGKPELNYDPAISVLLDQSKNDAVPPDLWPLFVKIPSSKEILLVRGEHSDILSIKCVQKMQQFRPHMQFVEIANCGHAPLLTEPKSLEKIDRFLAELGHGS